MHSALRSSRATVPPPPRRQHDAVRLAWHHPQVRHPRGRAARVLQHAPPVLRQAQGHAAAGGPAQSPPGWQQSPLLRRSTAACCAARPCSPRPALPPPPPQAAEADLLRISNKVRFILAVVSGALKLSNRRKADVEAELEAQGYDRLAPVKKAAAAQVRACVLPCPAPCIPCAQGQQGGACGRGVWPPLAGSVVRELARAPPAAAGPRRGGGGGGGRGGGRHL